MFELDLKVLIRLRKGRNVQGSLSTVLGKWNTDTALEVLIE